MEINKPIAIIILVIIDLVLIFLFIFPKYQESRDLQMSLAEKNLAYEIQSGYYEKVSTVLKGVDSRQDILKKVDSALPSDPSFAPIVYFLQTESDKNGLTVKSITFSQVASETGQTTSQANSKQALKSITFMVNLSGKYQGLKNLLFSLERSARLFEVNAVSFASLDTRSFFINQ